MKMTQKKRVLATIGGIVLLSSMVFAGGNKDASFNTKRAITVISREAGSGTRGAFVELTGVEAKNAEGKKVDYTTEEALITNSTSVMMTTVSSDEYAIGYVSLGFVNNTVKAVSVDGVEPSVTNIKNGSYKLVRPFNIVTNNANELSESAQDFINFIMSKEGQSIVTANGFIGSDDATTFKNNRLSNPTKVVVAGSSSVTPVMEKLKEAYAKIRPSAVIEIQQSDSTTGITSVKSGICDIGMASRALKDSELSAGLVPTVIAQDGIAVVINNINPVNNLSKNEIKDIFTGKVTIWNEIVK